MLKLLKHLINQHDLTKRLHIPSHIFLISSEHNYFSREESIVLAALATLKITVRSIAALFVFHLRVGNVMGVRERVLKCFKGLNSRRDKKI